jgi:hypothetical protein
VHRALFLPGKGIVEIVMSGQRTVNIPFVEGRLGSRSWSAAEVNRAPTFRRGVIGEIAHYFRPYKAVDDRVPSAGGYAFFRENSL